jgi:transcriptional regulator with XRE-family HTH domain
MIGPEVDDMKHQRLLVAAINAEIGGRGWTRKYLGEKSGISPQQMERIFNLKRQMTVQQWGAIADALGVTMDYLAAESRKWETTLTDDEIIDSAKELTERQKAALRSELRSTRMPRDSPDKDVVQSPNASGGEAV